MRLRRETRESTPSVSASRRRACGCGLRVSCSTRASSGLAAAQKINRHKRSVLFTKVSYATSSTAMELTRSKLHHCMYCSDRVVRWSGLASGSGRVVRPLRVVRTRVVRPRG